MSPFVSDLTLAPQAAASEMVSKDARSGNSHSNMPDEGNVCTLPLWSADLAEGNCGTCANLPLLGDLIGSQALCFSNEHLAFQEAP